jgi:hypothetical protein
MNLLPIMQEVLYAAEQQPARAVFAELNRVLALLVAPVALQVQVGIASPVAPMALTLEEVCDLLAPHTCVVVSNDSSHTYLCGVLRVLLGFFQAQTSPRKVPVDVFLD